MVNYKKRILFLGIPDMALICLDACYQKHINIVGVMGPKPDHYTFSVFKKFVKDKGLNFIEYVDLKSPHLLDQIKKLNVDLAIVCSFNYKIPNELLEIPKDGFINLHPSLLPLYRGANPYSRVIMNNETETGVTLHFMSAEFDQGDIILQKKCSVDNNETMGTLFSKTNLICVELLLSALTEYEKNILPRIVQPQGEFKKALNLSEQEEFINFNDSAENIERLVRALNPYIYAKTYFRNEFIKVAKVEVIKKQYSDEISNGTIVDISDNKLIIKTSKNCINISVMQYGGYFIGDSKDFIEHLNPKTGEKFFNG